MRISSGRLGGRSFESPKNNRTHPMSDRVRSGLFNALGDIEGLSVLDAFAGSGALSFEALSRGAQPVLMIENDHLAQASITRNLQTLAIENKAKLVKASAGAWLATSDALFNLVLLDPPYDDTQPELLVALAARTAPHGIVVFSLPPTAEVTLPASDYLHLSTKDYGDAQLRFYRATG